MRFGLFAPSIVLVASLFLLSATPQALAQNAPSGLGIPGLDGIVPQRGDREPVLAFAAIVPGASANEAQLQITAAIEPTYHIYSLTQPPGGPLKTKIELVRSAQFEVVGDFYPTPAPKSHIDQDAYPGLTIEEHEGKVTWAAPIRLAAGVAPADLRVQGKLSVLACQDDGSCIPLDLAFAGGWSANGKAIAIPTTADAPNSDPLKTPAQPVAGTTASDVKSTTLYRAENSSVAISGHIEPSTIVPGGTARVVLTARPDTGWHIYAWEATDPKRIGAGKPTLIRLKAVPGPAWHAATPTSDLPPQEKKSDFAGVERFHEREVNWTVEVHVPQDAVPGAYEIAGLIGYQVCYLDQGCKPPLGAEFRGQIEVGQAEQPGTQPLELSQANYSDAARLSEADADASAMAAVQAAAAGPSPPGAAAAATGTTLLSMILAAFVGGIILNLMPCVLPVIGLKVMSLVEQSGQSRSEALKLNLWYSAGLLSVFLVLAGLAVFAGMAWGEHFGSDVFNITLAAIVFAMALSMLGVWEIPIPGFVGGSKAHNMSSREGPGGAFLKGVLTTVLATPCTGPFMGAALGWAVSQPAASTFSVFTSLGLGMASPYLLIGVFPSLVRWLPRPGAWMETFKQLMGFFLVGTVVFLLTFIEPPHVVPTLALLAGVGAGCWWISRTPLTAEFDAKAMAWLSGTAFAGLVGWFAFAGPPYGLDYIMASRFSRYVQRQGGEIQFERAEGEIDWQPFSEERLAFLQTQGTTVLVDFTADWCTTCKEREANVLNTEEVKQQLKDNNVATLQADFTNKPPEIKEMLHRLDSAGVPVIAIYGASRPGEPKVFRGWYTQSDILEALNAAGPSRTVETTAQRQEPLRSK